MYSIKINITFMIMISFAVTIICYLLITYNTLRFARGTISAKQLRTASVFAWIGIIIHMMILSQQIISADSINIGAANAFSLTIIIMLITAIPNLQRHPDIIFFLFALAIIALVFSFSNDSPFNLTTIRPILSIHILTSIAAYAILMLAAIQAFMIFFRHSSLKKKPSLFLTRLPPIMSMERWLFQLILIGWSLLSLSLISAIPFFDLWFSKPFFHRTIFSILSWGLFSVLLFMRHVKGLRGKRAAQYTVLAFLILLVGVISPRLIQEFFINRT